MSRNHTASNYAPIEAEAIEWLVRLNRRDISAEQEQAFFQWLNASPLHQAAYIKAEDLWQRGEVLAKAKTLAPPKPLQPAAGFAWGGWGWAAAVSCVFLLGLWFMQPGKVETQHYASKLGEQQRVELADGSHLLLNSNSAVVVSLEKNERRVELQRGQVFFEVASNPRRPFTVHTAQGQVRVVGTRFAVRQLDGDAQVTVLEGKVALGQGSGDEFSAQQLLQANQQLSLKQAQAGEAPTVVEADNLLAWREQQLIFNARPLGEVVRELEHYYGVQIHIATPELAAREITAVLQLTDQHTTRAQLAAALGLHWEPGDTPQQWRLRE